MSDDICYWSLAAAAEKVRRQEISPLELLDAVAARAERVNPKINAYCLLDLDGARARAREAGEALARGRVWGPLHGVPVAVKDDLAVAGLRLTAGCQLLAGHVARQDEMSVARLKAAGAVIVGKTNMPEFGHKATTDNLIFGTTRNPWHTGRTAGGSSGGSAAAVAAGLAYMAMGTDIGGSVRIPASCCGLVGLKPSFGRIPRTPAINAFNTVWSSGPLARSVADLLLCLEVLSGPDPRDRYSLPALRPEELTLDADLRGLRVGWIASPTGEPVEPVVAESAERAARLLERRGAEVVALRETLQVPMGAVMTLFYSDCTSVLPLMGIKSRWGYRLLRGLGFCSKKYRFSPTFAELLDRGIRVTLPQYFDAQQNITHYLETKAAAFLEGIDVLATATITVPPFAHTLPLGPGEVNGIPIDPRLGWLCTWPFNLTGQPAVSVPCGWTDDGLPLGLQLVGKPGADLLLLQMAAAVEEMAPWSDRRPPL